MNDEIERLIDGMYKCGVPRQFVAIDEVRSALREAKRQAFEEAARICKSKGDAESDYRMKRPYLPPSEVNQYVEREVAFYACEKTLQARADSLKESQ